MRRDAEPWLIAAVTGRALAQSAVRGGYSVVVLDFFGDRDTRSVAQQVETVMATDALRFDRVSLLAAASRLAAPAHSAGLVYGSGFEGRIPLLRRLATERHLHGNPIPVLTLVRDPRRFFPLLDAIGVAHPEVRYASVADPGDWLCKSAGGAGGAHVRPASSRPPRRGAYLQRRMPGRSLSALFLADGRHALVLGFNEQWTSPARAEAPYLFGGAAGGVPLPPALAADIAERLDALVARTGLRGLNGIDFLLHEDRWHLLEVNPRPTATMELHDPDYPRGLFDAHLQAVAGVLPRAAAPSTRARAMSNVYSSASGLLGSDFPFPDWCRDIPMAGTRIGAGDPVCTVHADAADTIAATTLVRQRQESLEGALREYFAAPVPA